jgi:hypothetical protein
VIRAKGRRRNGLFCMSGSESWSRGFESSFCLCSNVIKLGSYTTRESGFLSPPEVLQA